ncbi:TPA: hypothetical protein N0F65_005736, partial [Lagenidium giganteum]
RAPRYVDARRSADTATTGEASCKKNCTPKTKAPSNTTQPTMAPKPCPTPTPVGPVAPTTSPSPTTNSPQPNPQPSPMPYPTSKAPSPGPAPSPSTAPAPSPSGGGNSGGVDAKSCLDAHNKVREAVGVPALQWDDSLAAKGAQWAQHMEDMNFFDHHTPGKSDSQMNNLFSGTDCLEAVKCFEAEKSKFPADRIVRAESYMQYGHYSMMVWKTTTRVGCGRGKTKNLACYYEEPGNQMGKPANPAPTATPSVTPAPTFRPATQAPEPATTAPAPVTAAPTPTTATPVPTTATPVPTTATPVPTTATPVPTTATPVPTTAAPVPTTAAPVPTTEAPAPTTVSPTPTPASPEQNQYAPATVGPSQSSTQVQKRFRPAYGGDSVDPATCLEAHNKVRADVGVSALEWDDALAAKGAEWAQHMEDLSFFGHSTPGKHDSQMNNLFSGTDCLEAVAMFEAEKEFFPADHVVRSSNFAKYGHYSMMVWKTTTRVGCGRGKTKNLSDSKACLEAHNKLRAEVGVPPLEWDDALAEKGAKWAQHMEDMNFFDHCTPGKNDQQMNNLYSGTDCLAAVKCFGDEKAKFPADHIVRAESFKDYGHYSMLIWKTTTKVGCGLGKTKNTACYYEEPGNQIGKAADGNGRVDAKSCLAEHNRVRADVGVPPLEWDDALAAKGEKWAQHMEDQDFFDHHTPGQNDKQLNNLYSGTDCLAAVKDFESEKSKVPSDRVVTGKNYVQGGHYTMMVWKTTTKVGCGAGKNKNLACYYDPPGNMIGEKAY